MTDFIKINAENFQNEVLDSKQPVLVDFTAEWCGPCKMLDPIIEELAKDWNGNIKVAKLDVDANPDLAMQYQVMGIPTLILFKNREPIERVSGYQSKDRLQKKFSPHLN